MEVASRPKEPSTNAPVDLDKKEEVNDLNACQDIWDMGHHINEPAVDPLALTPTITETKIECTEIKHAETIGDDEESLVISLHEGDGDSEEINADGAEVNKDGGKSEFNSEGQDIDYSDPVVVATKFRLMGSLLTQLHNNSTKLGVTVKSWRLHSSCLMTK